MDGFKKFLFRGNLIDLAVAVVIGGAFGKVITALVTDLVTPLISAFGHLPNFSSLIFRINRSNFAYGDFFNALLSFLVVAAIIYFVIMAPITKLAQRKSKPDEDSPPVRECPECLSSIPAAAKRCMYCTAVSAPAS